MPGQPAQTEPRRASWFGLLIGTILAIAGGAFIWASFFDQTGAAGISPTALYTTRLSDREGKSVAIGQWQGKVLLINFWATWCTPCREEIPHLVAAQRRYADKGLQVIGIAIDKKKEVNEFSRQIGMDYPILIDEQQGISLSKRLGNGAGIVPFTALVDRQGKVIAAVAGALNADQLESLLRDRL